ISVGIRSCRTISSKMQREGENTAAQKVALWSQLASFSSFTGFRGILLASHVARDEFKNSSHLTLALAKAFAVTIT
ncbi:hypothetical protein KC19_VG153700, partial [Ceratodon purpureus]